MYKVTNEDLIGEIKGFPIEVVMMMLKRQFEQIGRHEVRIFQFNRTASANGDGFDWDKSEEGWDFWNEVIFLRRFYLFNERYKDICIELQENPRYSQLRTMTKVEKWLLSKIKCEKALSRRDRLQYLVDQYCGTLYSIPKIVSNETFDWIPISKNLSEAKLIFLDEIEVDNCDQDYTTELLSDRIGDYTDILIRFYRAVDSIKTINGHLIPFGGVSDIRTVIGWIKKNLGVACRLKNAGFLFTDKNLYVSHLGPSDGVDGYVKDSVGYCYRNDNLFIIGGHIFEIK